MPNFRKTYVKAIESLDINDMPDASSGACMPAGRASEAGEENGCERLRYRIRMPHRDHINDMPRPAPGARLRKQRDEEEHRQQGMPY